MTAPCFVDSNVLIYFRDASEPKKQAQAAAWLSALWQSRAGRLSVQVLSEFYVTVTQKLRPGMDAASAWTDVRNLMVWQPVPLDLVVLGGGRAVQDRYQLSWWDSLIVSAAQVAGCRFLLTEDLQNGQIFDSVEVVDPFQQGPDLLGL
jgi:predicted nucleic acid-binding protein